MRTSVFLFTIFLTTAVMVSAVGALYDAASSTAIPRVVRTQFEAMELFADRCATCHGKYGAGDSTRGKAMKVPDLRAAEIQKKSDKELFDAIVKSAAHRGLQKQLGDAKLRMTIAHVRTLKATK